MKTLFVSWREATTGERIPVARLDWDGSFYRFSYTKGALRATSFEPFGKMIDLRGVYRSDKLFAMFLNRLISKSRPEYLDYLRWMGLNPSVGDEMDELGISGGRRGTDSIEVVPMPVRNEAGNYSVEFFARGLLHFNASCVEAVKQLREGDRLWLVKDAQNAFDTYAMFMRTENPIHSVGYVPRLYAKDLGHMLDRFGSEVDVRVKRVNDDAPLSMRLLCTLNAPWFEGFRPFATEDFVSLSHGE